MYFLFLVLAEWYRRCTDVLALCQPVCQHWYLHIISVEGYQTQSCCSYEVAVVV